MDFRVRVGGMLSVFGFYAVQLVMISYHHRKELTDHNMQSYKGLVAVDILLLFVVVLYLVCKWLAISAVDKFIVLFDSVLFALSFCWMVLAAPVVDVLVGFFVCNIIIATSTVLLDLYEFRQFSKIYQQLQGNNASSLATSTIIDGDIADEGRQNPIRDVEVGNSYEHINGHEGGGQGSRKSSDVEEDVLHRVRVRASSNVREVKYMPRAIDLAKKGVLDGFRVNLQELPEIDESIPRDLPWSTFEDVTHTVDSSSCHIYTARWGDIPVILKLIKEDRITSAVAVAEFDIEERVLSRVRHPHIVRLLGSGTQPRKYLVLEHLSGGTLSHSLGVRQDRVKQRWLKKFTLLETLKMAHGLAQALNYLHNEWSDSVHIIHRDLKPDNIGWSADGVLKLFDFGLSVSVRAQRERTEQYKLTGNTGTLRYMAPEVVLGRSYNQTVDTYSFGILIWQIAAGQIPFRDMGKKTYFDRVVIKGVRPALEVRWPPAFCELLRNCWHEDKNARPSFREIASELAELVAEEEAIEAAHSNRCSTYTCTSLVDLLLCLRPLYMLVSLVLLGCSFILSTQHEQEVDNDISAGAILSALAALALYASTLNYMCGAWPAVPLQDAAAKINLDITADVGDAADIIRPQKVHKKSPPEVEMGHLNGPQTTSGSNLFGTVSRAERSASHSTDNTASIRTAQVPSVIAAGMRDGEEEDVEVGFGNPIHQQDAATSSASSPAHSKSRGLFSGLQDKVTRVTGSAHKQSRRAKDFGGPGNVIFSPLSNVHDEEGEGGAAEQGEGDRRV